MEEKGKRRNITQNIILLLKPSSTTLNREISRAITSSALGRKPERMNLPPSSSSAALWDAARASCQAPGENCVWRGAHVGITKFFWDYQHTGSFKIQQISGFHLSLRCALVFNSSEVRGQASPGCLNTSTHSQGDQQPLCVRLGQKKGGPCWLTTQKQKQK